MSGTDLVHLHTHTEYSILDGCGKQEAFIEYAKHLGLPAFAATEHGSLRGAYKLHEDASFVGGIKPIYGIEFYVAKDHLSHGLRPEEMEAITKLVPSKTAQNKAIREREQETGVKKRNHITVLAKNNEGLKNLYKLSSISWTDGFYVRPRIDLGLLHRYGDGLIVLSGCLDGFVSEAILNDDFDGALRLVDRFRGRWGDDFYLEIMPNSLPQQVKVNAALARISEVTGIPLVATADVHYILKSDWKAHEVLLCVNTKRKLSDPNRWTFGARDFWYQTRKEMEENFAKYHKKIPRRMVLDALDTTVKIADKCSAALDIDRFRALVPRLEIPREHKNEFQWLLAICNEGWNTRDIPRRAAIVASRRGKPQPEIIEEYAARLKHELTLIRDKKVSGYFLIIRDMYTWARTSGIVCGPGRGSAGGSLVSFLAGITDVDPVEHGLIFERFLNPSRIDLPDIDCDFEDRRRGEIIRYLHERYGYDKVSQISTVTRMTGKSCLRDLARVLDVPPGDIEAVVKSIVMRSSGDERASQTIEDAMVEFEVGRDFNERYPDVLGYAKRLEGQARGLGLHAAGVIVSRDTITDWVPIETREHNGTRVKCTAWDMFGAEAQGLMKIDVLGLRTLAVISDALNAIKERTGEDVDLNWIDLNDAKVLKNFTDLNFCGIFQFDTTSAEKICEGVTFDRFDDIPALVALDRPGTARSGLATEYLKRKANPKARVSIHPVIDTICEDTLGIIVYQEHVIKIFIDVAGFPPGTADSLRKKIAKKWGDETLGKERDNFIAGAKARGFPEKLAADVFDKIKFFGSYGFNKSHATAYGLISYWEMWLKTYYPTEFLWGLLSNEPDQSRIVRLIRETKRLGIEVLPPSVGESKETFSITPSGAIRSGLVNLKGVGTAAVKSIVANQPYDSFVDFANRVNLRCVHKGVITSLVKAGAFSDLISNTRWFLEHADEIWTGRGKVDWASRVTQLLSDSEKEPDYSDDDRVLVAAEVSPLAFGKHPLEPYMDFYNSMSVEWVTTDGDGIWERKWAWLRGIVVEIRYNQVGDFHTGKEPGEQEKKRMCWGARYANINVEDESGVNKRVKIDYDVFDRVRSIVDKGNGIPVAVLATVDRRWNAIKARIALDISELKRNIATGKELSPFEMALVKPQTLLAGLKQRDLTRKLARGAKGKLSGVAFVASVQKKLDKNMNEMAFMCLFGRGGLYQAVCFTGAWQRYGKMVKEGTVMDFVVTSKGDSVFVESVSSIE